MTVLTEGSRVSQLLLLRLYLQIQRAERCDEHDGKDAQDCSHEKKTDKVEASGHNTDSNDIGSFFSPFILEDHSSLLKLMGCMGTIFRVLGDSLYLKSVMKHLKVWNIEFPKSKCAHVFKPRVGKLLELKLDINIA